MSAILGIINVRHDDDGWSRTLDQMAKAHKRSGDGRWQRISTPAAAMAAIGGLVAAECHQEGTLLVALQGDVRFDTPDLVRHADTFGTAAAVARAYSSFGPDCLRHMHGAFAMAIADGTRKRGLVAIDRMAIRSLAYARVGDGVVFGTSVAAVAAHPAVGRRVDLQGVFNYLYCENVPAPGSIYEGVSKLLPGQRLLIEDGTVRTDFYWQLEYRDVNVGDEAGLRAEFLELLRVCVARTAPTGDEGAFLSGGTDSSTVTGFLTELRGRPADTYSIGFDAEGYDEMEYARIVARHFGSRAHEYYVTPRDVADAVTLIPAAYDEPFGNASAVPTYYCARLAKEDGRTVLLAGDGGDEIFGGNERYAKQKMFEAYGLLPSPLRHGLIEPVLLGGSWADRIAVLRKARSYVQQARIPLPDRLETYNFLERQALGEIFEPGFLSAVDPHQPRDMAREVFGRTKSESAVNRMMHLDLKETLADNDLRKVNVMCELAGLQVRYPLLDDDLVAFSGRLSPAQKVKGLRLRHFFKESLKDFLPPQTISKSKHGFGLPFGVWMKRDNALRDITIDSLRSFKTRGYLRPEYLDDLLHLHESSHAGYYGVMIWIIMMLERWLAAQEQPAATDDVQPTSVGNMPCASA